MSEQTTSSTTVKSDGAPNDGKSPVRRVSDNPLARLAEALAAERGEVPGSSSPDDGTTPPGKPTDLTGLANALKMDPAELYKITVPSSREGAEPYTLGKLKDLAAEHDDFTVRSLALEEQYRERQAEVVRAEQELQAIMATLPPDAIKPEARVKLQEKRNAVLSVERQRVLTAIPEWRDADVRTSEMEQIIEHLKDYGFPETYLTSVFDHRTLRYVRDNWRREKQIRAALEKVAERKDSTPPKSKRGATDKPAPKPNGAERVSPQQNAFSSAITSKR